MQTIKQYGFITYEDFINKKLKITNMKDFTIVGVVDTGSPCIYANDSVIMSVIANGKAKTYDELNDEFVELYDYNLHTDDIIIKKGSLPINDYEVIVNINEQYEYPLNKNSNIKINGNKLKVVGYYDNMDSTSKLYVNSNTLKYNTVLNNEGATVYAKDKYSAIEALQAKKVNVEKTLEKSRDEYNKQRRKNVISKLVVAGVTVTISIIEIYLIMRSSFLSRIKEVGTLRAIGMKKRDIFMMFVGEAMAISLIVSTSGVILMSYILKELATISILESYILINLKVVLLSIATLYTCNLFFGLLPLTRTLKKMPSEIIKRNDFD